MYALRSNKNGANLMIRDHSVVAVSKGPGNSETVDDFLVYAHSIESIYSEAFAEMRAARGSGMKGPSENRECTMLQFKNPATYSGVGRK
jgi:hypothetical protein